MDSSRETADLPTRTRINLAAVATSLRRAQREAQVALGSWGGVRDPMDDRVIENMVAGYSFVNCLVTSDIEIFAMGHLRYLLEMNTVVLCGTLPARREAYARHIEATATYFYDDRGGNVRALMEWQAHRDRSIWDRAAGLYVQLLTKPQLFIEGNHRTGALLMSYVLMRHGLPPFVLGSDTAAPYFELSSGLRNLDKRSPASAFRAPAIRQRLATLLAEHSDRHYLIPLTADTER